LAIGVAVIGAGMAGRGHAAAFRAARSLYETNLPEIKLVAIGDVNLPYAESAANKYGYEKTETDWRAIAENPEIDAVSVVVANHLHREIVEGLLSAGKHVLCEKPLSDTLAAAQSMVEAAKKSKSIARIGLTFLNNPGVAAVARIVKSGQIGEVLHFSGRFFCDYSIDPTSPITWRYKGGLGSGALADLGSHVIYLTEFVTGQTIKSVSGAQFQTVIKQRPVAAGAVFGHQKAAVSSEIDIVENDDYEVFTASLGEASGVIEASRVAAGHPNTLSFEIYCEGGAVSFDLRKNGQFELMVNEGDPSQKGFKSVLIGPTHPFYGGGLPLDAPGLGVGQNDQFFFQNRAFLQEVAGLPESEALPYCPDFSDGLRNMRTISSVVDSFNQAGATVSVPTSSPSYLRNMK
jgi:predicted dehydrogenase